MRKFFLSAIVFLLVSLSVAAEPQVFFQAHRGGMHEVPENTLAALKHAWSTPGAVPEVDLRTTKDGRIICIHDDTPARTIDAPAPWASTRIDEIPYETLREWDAGIHFDAAYAGEKVPSLEEVFALIKADPERRIYLDLKGVDVAQLRSVIEQADLLDRIIFVLGNPILCRRFAEAWPGAKTMTWLSGPPEFIDRNFTRLVEQGFPGLSQIQFHLKSKTTEAEIEYVFDDDYLRKAAAAAAAHGVDFQLRPFDFTPASLRRLIGLGAHWYVSDDPKAFAKTVEEALAETSEAE